MSKTCHVLDKPMEDSGNGESFSYVGACRNFVETKISIWNSWH